MPVGAACPIPVDYSKADQRLMAGELKTIPKAAKIRKFLADYYVERQQLKAARGGLK